MSQYLVRLFFVLGALVVVSLPSLPVQASSRSLISVMEKDLGGKRPKFCPAKWCACYMDIVLQKAGFEPLGSYRARDFARYGKKAKPGTPGAIMVMRHHVGVVAGTCPGNRVLLISGNYSHKVSVGCYSPHHAIAWRIPAGS